MTTSTRAERLLEVHPYSALAPLTVDVAAAAGFGFVRVFPMPAAWADTRDGRCNPSARVVWLADRAPLHIVAHEVAHLLAPADGHGPVWREWFNRLAVALTP